MTLLLLNHFVANNNQAVERAGKSQCLLYKVSRKIRYPVSNRNSEVCGIGHLVFSTHITMNFSKINKKERRSGGDIVDPLFYRLKVSTENIVLNIRKGVIFHFINDTVERIVPFNI